MPINFRHFKPLRFTFIELSCRRNKIDIARRGKINSTHTKKALPLPLRNGTHNGRPAIKNSSISVKLLKVRLNKMFCQCTLQFDRAPANTDLHVVEHMQGSRNLENDWWHFSLTPRRLNQKRPSRSTSRVVCPWDGASGTTLRTKYVYIRWGF